MLKKELQLSKIAKLAKPGLSPAGKGTHKGPAKSPSPLRSVDGGRDTGGRFTKGNQCARGNVINARVAEWRDAVALAVSGPDVAAVMKAMLKAAKGGDVAAARIVLERTLGRVPIDLNEFRLALEKPSPDDVFD